jgi:hypothetical protein
MNDIVRKIHFESLQTTEITNRIGQSPPQYMDEDE